MKRLITWLVVLAVLAYLAFKAGIWWLADQQAAALQDALQETAVVERGEVGSGLAGHLVLDNARYQDFRLTQPLQIGQLRFVAGSPVQLVTSLLNPRNLPARWTLEAEPVTMALDAAMFSNWVTESPEARPSSVLAPVCGPDHRQQLGTGGLVRMGINRLEGDLLVQQSPDALRVELNTEQTGSLEIHWPGARLDITDPGQLPSTSAQPMDLTLRDAGMMRRISAFCARESGVSPDEWTGIVMDSFRDGLEARGYRASDQLLALYRQWLREGGELTLALDPARPVWGIPVYEPQSASAGDSVAITYNGSRVPDVYLERIPPQIPETPAEAVEPVTAPEPTEPGWRSVPLEDAGRWIGQTVRVTLSTGRVVEGRLERVEDGEELEVTRMVNGGEVAYPMAQRAVTGFEIWYRGGNP
jgi:hypothetical protein